MTGFRSLFRAIAHFAKRQLRDGAVDRRAAFWDIYTRNAWGSNESVSGRGSELGFTSRLQTELAELLRELGIHSLADAPCGDFNWMQHVDLAGVRYLGVDIVADLIDANRRRHGREDLQFRTLDIVSEQIQRSDLIFCRHCFIHLSNEDVRAAVSNFCKSGSTWLLTTHSVEVQSNGNIESGSFRLVNLERSPFNFPPPQRMIRDDPATEGTASGFLGLWRVASLERSGH